MVSDMNIFVWKLSKIAVQKKVFFLTFFTFEVPFNGLFAPTSQSWMSNIFLDWKCLGKSNEKKWSNIWTFLFGSGLKSPRKKKFFFCWFCLGPPSYGVRATVRIGREMLCLPYAGFFIYIWLLWQFPDLRVLTGSHCGRPIWHYKRLNKFSKMSVSRKILCWIVGKSQNTLKPFFLNFQGIKNMFLLVPPSVLVIIEDICNFQNFLSFIKFI